MSTDSAKRHFKLSKGALGGLKMILTNPEWFKGDAEAVKHSYRAGQLLEEVIPDYPAMKPATETNAQGDRVLKEGENDKLVAWEKELAPEFDVTEKQFETIKKAIEWAVKNGFLPNGSHKNMLICQTGLNPDA